MLDLTINIYVAACLYLTQAIPFNHNTYYATEMYRLPHTVSPLNYNLTLRPYLLDSDSEDKRFTFDGEVFIEVMAKMDTNTISLHSKDLNYSLSSYWFKSIPNSKFQLNKNNTNFETDIIVLELHSQITINTTIILHFVYTGIMKDDMFGFYRSSYRDTKNNIKWFGCTHFEANHARRVFPSFDEPRFKATFDVSLIRHKSLNTFSNTRLLSSHLYSFNNSYYVDTYTRTPNMSTYLLAFIVSEFHTRNNGDFGVIARPDFYEQTEYSFDVGILLLDALSNYLELPYYNLGINKLDMAAISDFSGGGLENWGMITFKERNLLYLDNKTTLSSKQHIAAAIAHEQAHMWFGNYVTCEWWSYTWLNEGFARYFQYIGTALIETYMELDKQFVVDLVQSVMGIDSTNSTNPMSDENTNTLPDIVRMFNSISYDKGAAFIRMIEHAIGKEAFQKSLNQYLNKYNHKNVIPQNLLDIWKANWPFSTRKYADAIFESFTTQVGYPVIVANLVNGNSIEFTQKRFLLKENDGSDPTPTYTVPITYTTSVEMNFNNTAPKFVLPNNQSHTEILSTKVDWIIANIQETGYYRVNYTEMNWHGIHHALYENNWSGIHELNRAQIVDDLLNLARANQLSYDLALNVLEYLETETNYLPWTSAFNGFNYLAIRLGTDIAHFGNYIRQLTAKAYNQLGFEERTSDNTLDIHLRNKILSWNCRYNNLDCVSRAKSIFKTIGPHMPVPINIRSVVYCVGIREGGNVEFEVLYNKLKQETVATEETLLQTSLGCAKKQDLIERVFNLVLSDEIRRQDKPNVLAALYNENNENISPVFDLITNNVDDLAKALGSYSAVASVISNIASRFTEEKQQQDLIYFNNVNGSKFGNSITTLRAAELTVAENLEWATTRLTTFKIHLAKRNSNVKMNPFVAVTLISLSMIAKVVL